MNILHRDPLILTIDNYYINQIDITTDLFDQIWNMFDYNEKNDKHLPVLVTLKPMESLFLKNDAYFCNKSTNNSIKIVGQNIMTGIIFLNTIDNGGELYFPVINIKIPQIKGTLVCFVNCNNDGITPNQNAKYGILPTPNQESNIIFYHFKHYDPNKINSFQLSKIANIFKSNIPNKTELNKTELNKTELNKTEPSKTESNKTELNKTELSKTESNKTEPNSDSNSTPKKINNNGTKTNNKKEDISMESLDNKIKELYKIMISFDKSKSKSKSKSRSRSKPVHKYLNKSKKNKSVSRSHSRSPVKRSSSNIKTRHLHNNNNGFRMLEYIEPHVYTSIG